MTDGSATAGLNGSYDQVADWQIHDALHPMLSVNRCLATGKSPCHRVPLAFLRGRRTDLVCRTVLNGTPLAAADPNAGFGGGVDSEGRQLDLFSLYDRVGHR